MKEVTGQRSLVASIGMKVKVATVSVTVVIGKMYLLSWERVCEGLEHVVLILDAQLGAALLVNALLPQHVLSVENKWLGSHDSCSVEFDCSAFLSDRLFT